MRGEAILNKTAHGLNPLVQQGRAWFQTVTPASYHRHFVLGHSVDGGVDTAEGRVEVRSELQQEFAGRDRSRDGKLMAWANSWESDPRD